MRNDGTSVTEVPVASPADSPPPVAATRGGLSLKSNFIWTFFSNVIYAGCQWLMLIALAKLGTPETVGAFALGLAVTGPVIMFTNLQLRGVQVTDAKREYKFGDYLGLRLLSIALSLAVFGIIVLVSNYSLTTAIVVFVIGITKVFDSLSDIIYGLLQQREKMDRIAISRILQGVLQLAVLSIALWLTHNLIWAVLGMAIVSGVITLIYDIPNAINILKSEDVGDNPRIGSYFSLFRPNWCRKKLIKLVVLSLPLGLVMLAVSLNINVPQYFIEHNLGVYQLGVFAALTSLTMIDTQVISALGQVASPRLSQYYAEGKIKSFQKLIMQLAIIAGIIGGLVLLISLYFGAQIIAKIFAPEYARYFATFIWIMIGSGIYNVTMIFGYGITSARRFNVQLTISTIVLVVIAVLCYVLVNPMGMLGVAVASTVGTIVYGIGNLYILMNIIRSSKKLVENS